MAAVQSQETQDNTDAVTGFNVHVQVSYGASMYNRSTNTTASRLKMSPEGSMTSAMPFLQYTLVSPKCDQDATKRTVTDTEAEGPTGRKATAGMR